MSWAAILGFRKRSGVAARTLDHARVEAMRMRRPIWLSIQALGAGVMVALRAGSLPPVTVVAWAAAVIGICGIMGWNHRSSGNLRLGVRWTETDFAAGLLLATAWGIALALFGGGDDGSASLHVFALSACMLAATGTLLSASPSGGLAFIVVTGAAASTAMLVGGHGMMALVAFGYTGFCAGKLLFDARALVRRLGAEAALAEKQEMVSLLLHEFEDTGGDWLWRTDETRRLIDVSPRLARQFGRSRRDVEGQSLVALLAGDDWESGSGSSLRELAERLHRRESFRDLKVPVRIAGEVRWWSLSATPRRDESGGIEGFIGVGTDVTDAQRSAEKIDRMARFDALTGLANRPQVIAALGDALRDGHRLGRRSAFMLIDLDRFKQVNDTLGHPIGDRLLIEVAGRLTDLVGEDDICARLGGDEFAIVLPDASDRDRVETIAETIVTSLSAPFDIDGHRLHIGASVGSATAPRDGRAVETMLRNADLALYRAKDDGRGVHRRYEPQLHAAADERRRIEQALREAIELGQLRLVYQPIAEARDGRITAFEALLRWTHPELGPVSPEIFIPVAEEARLIGRIGDWVMHTACRDAAGWADGVRVTVNLAVGQLMDNQLTATIVSALSHSGLEADRLEVEIGEEVFLREARAAAAVDRLLGLGIRVTLDDFATSRSTLGYLRKGRFSTIKIDRSFVRGASANHAESLAIVRAIVAIADGLGMDTIAEGAETRAEYDRMARLGIANIQGWHVGQPLDAAGAADLAASRGGERRVA